MKPSAAIETLERALPTIMRVDAAWCERRLRAARQRLRGGKPVDRILAEVAERATVSAQRNAARRSGLPRPDYDAALPITAHREQIVAALAEHQVLIVAGETGSGKTTQLPKFCLEAGRGTRGLIGCTQPRRIAARAMADRVAEELGSTLGQQVGFQVRFREQVSRDSYIKFMTDGILLAEITHDRDLDAYDTLIIDEAHERSLNIDFLLGYLKQLLPRRPELRVVITSATIDTEKFSRHFDNAPVIEVSGRGYPVDVLYQPIGDAEADSEPGGRDLYHGIAEAVGRLSRIDPAGDILVFLSGEREIREAGDYLSRQKLRNTEILPLYARLSSAEQRRVFHPGGARRIILSTNVAETSLTVPRIRFVIDSGLVRISRYAHRSRIQRLPIEPVSQASANQRMGRCGRIGPGTCVRLYGEEDFDLRPEFTEPEILRTSLASVILRMLTMGLGAVEDFPFIDRPAPRMINDAYQLLFELGAVDGKRMPTAMGRQLSGWPLDVRIGRMVIEGDRQGCLEDLLVLAAAVSIQDPRERPLDAQAAADEAHARFADEKSDFVALLRLWEHLRKQRRENTGNQFRKLCRREFLNWQRVLEWFDLYQQLRDQAREERLSLRGGHGSYEQVHTALLSGLLSHVGLRNPEDPGYTGARNRGFHIFPGSGLFGRSPKWLMAGEIVETTRPYARINAAIQPHWIEKLANNLLKRHYFDPHWSKRAGEVMAWEQVSLFGLVIVEKRRVKYARFDPQEARRIFILEALVRGELDTRAEFMQRNAELRVEIDQLEQKRRARDVVADEADVYAFFDARVPDDVFSARSLEKWLERLGSEGRRTLLLSHEILMREDAGGAPGELYPDYLEVGGQQLPLTYSFMPGDPADGVSVTLPLELLNQLDEGRVQWLVPGLLREKAVALIKGLPKPLRRAFTPPAQFADAALQSLTVERPAALLPWLARTLGDMTGVEIGVADFDETVLPDYLRFRFVMQDRKGKVLAIGRDLGELQEKFGSRAQRKFMDQQGGAWNRDGLSDWEFGELPATAKTASGATAWPALVDQGDAAGMRLFDTADEAAQSHLEGVRRLLAIKLADKLRYLQKQPGISKATLLQWSPFGTTAKLLEELAWASLCAVADDQAMGVRDEAAFRRLEQDVRRDIGAVHLKLGGYLKATLDLLGVASSRLDSTLESRLPAVFEDVDGQLSDLVYDGFLLDLEPERFAEYPRFFEAMCFRLERVDQNPARDAGLMAQVSDWWGKYLAHIESGGEYDEALDTFRWLIEEFRVSLFAQHLGTKQKASAKRLEKAWRAVQEAAR